MPFEQIGTLPRDITTPVNVEARELVVLGQAKSRSYVAGTSGWILRGDGSGEITGNVTVGGTIDAGQITTGTLSVDRLAAGSITGTKIDAATITGSNIQNGTITGAKIDSGTITGANIQSGTITGTNIQNGTITGTDIDAATITGSNIVNGTITGTKIDSATITGANITNSTIDSTKISSLTADLITTGTLNATNVNVTNINGTNVTTGSVASARLASTISGKTFRANTGSAGSPTLSFSSYTTHGISSASGIIRISVSGGTALYCTTTVNQNYNDTDPGGVNTYDLGDANNEWALIYSWDGSVEVSDENLKNWENETLGLDFIKSLAPTKWRWKETRDTAAVRAAQAELEQLAAQREAAMVDGKETPQARALDVQMKAKQDAIPNMKRPGNRFHHGLRAQQVVQALAANGVSTTDFAGVLEENGKYHLKYREFISPMIVAIQELAARVEALETP